MNPPSNGLPIDNYADYYILIPRYFGMVKHYIPFDLEPTMSESTTPDVITKNDPSTPEGLAELQNIAKRKWGALDDAKATPGLIAETYEAWIGKRVKITGHTDSKSRFVPHVYNGRLGTVVGVDPCPMPNGISTASHPTDANYLLIRFDSEKSSRISTYALPEQVELIPTKELT